MNAFSASSVPCGNFCSSIDESRVCNDGTLGGSCSEGRCAGDGCSSPVSASY